MTVRDAIGDLPVLCVTPDTPIGEEVMEYEENNAGAFVAVARKGCSDANELHDHQTRSVRADDYKAFKLMKPGTLYSDLPAEVKRYRDDIFNDKYNRFDWSGLSRTITAHIAKDGYWYIHPEQHRTLTVREAARIQTFPDSFRFAGSRSHQFRQIGNAVPPALLQWAKKGARVVAIDVNRNLDGSLAITVEDSGPGIPEADRHRIFEPYFSTKEDGVGLELSIAGEIVSDYYDGELIDVTR